jgi:hypothetical protein
MFIFFRFHYSPLEGAMLLLVRSPPWRVMNACDALEKFAKVRESTNDGSVYVNVGHCYFALDEFDRAIASVRRAFTFFFLHGCAPVLTHGTVRDGVTELLRRA